MKPIIFVPTKPEVIVMIGRLAILSIFIILSMISYSHAASKSTCPDKILDTNTIEGIYSGIECGDLCYIKLQLSDGDNLLILCDEEAVKNIFGTSTDINVSITYNIEQFWNEYGKECSRIESFQSGKILANDNRNHDNSHQSAQEQKHKSNIALDVEQIQNLFNMARMKLDRRGMINNILIWPIEDEGGGKEYIRYSFLSVLEGVFEKEELKDDYDRNVLLISFCEGAIRSPVFSKKADPHLLTFNDQEKERVAFLNSCQQILKETEPDFLNKAIAKYRDDDNKANELKERQKKVVTENLELPIDFVKKSYFFSFPDEGYLPFGEAFTKFFSRTSWKAVPIDDSSWSVIFKGVAQKNGRNAQFEIHFVVTVEDAMAKEWKDFYFAKAFANGSLFDLKELAAAIYLN